VAEAASALHLPPAALLETDSEVLEYLWPIAERARREDIWSREMLAVIAELVHAVWRVLVMAYAKKGTPPPKALRIPRPWQPDGPTDSRPRLSWGDLLKMIGKRRG